MIKLALLQQLLENRPLLDAAAQYASFDHPAAITHLRKLAHADLVRLAVELLTARRRAASKLALADQLLLDVTGVEQASSSAVASHKAARFASASPSRIIDLCTGIGGDALELARHLPATNIVLVDHAPSKIWMARRNVQLLTGRLCPAVCADVTRLNLRNQMFHLDPARRSPDGKRRHHFSDYLPGPDFISHLLSRCPTGAVKLGPGIDINLLLLTCSTGAGAGAGAGDAEIEFITEHHGLVQAVLWTGNLAHHPRSATILPPTGPAATLSGTGLESVPFSPIQRYLLAIDPAVERAALIGKLCDQLHAPAIHPKLGLLTSDHPIISPFTTCFEHLATLPVRKVAAWLKQHDAGIVQVKTRGQSADPDQLQSQWRGKGNTTYTIFVLRHDQLIQAHITQRI